jgi:hypothetical protein
MRVCACMCACVLSYKDFACKGLPNIFCKQDLQKLWNSLLQQLLVLNLTLQINVELVNYYQDRI